MEIFMEVHSKTKECESLSRREQAFCQTVQSSLKRMKGFTNEMVFFVSENFCLKTRTQGGGVPMFGFFRVR